jgi:hypothetical protein
MRSTHHPFSGIFRKKPKPNHTRGDNTRHQGIRHAWNIHSPDFVRHEKWLRETIENALFSGTSTTLFILTF